MHRVAAKYLSRPRLLTLGLATVVLVATSGCAVHRPDYSRARAPYAYQGHTHYAGCGHVGVKYGTSAYNGPRYRPAPYRYGHQSTGYRPPANRPQYRP
ncbi:MAG: hypothetical protein ACI91F_003673, partial [Candidatus Binatia bacterium]